LRVLTPGAADKVVLANEPYAAGTIRTGHFNTPAAPPSGPSQPPTLTHVKRLPASSMGASRETARDISNTLGDSAEGASWYAVTALCQEYPGGPEREVDFVVRVGLQ
ncbi:MAG TPA: hypothetical protein VGB96_11260, partial [Archangium sp.]